MLIWHRGWALTAKITQNVSSSHIFTSNEKFMKAAESWSVATDKLSNKVITWSFMADFCGGSLDRTYWPVGISSSGSTTVTMPSSRDWWSMTQLGLWIVQITALTSAAAIWSQDLTMCLLRMIGTMYPNSSLKCNL